MDITSLKTNQGVNKFMQIVNFCSSEWFHRSYLFRHLSRLTFDLGLVNLTFSNEETVEHLNNLIES